MNKEEIGLREILKNLKQLSANDLIALQEQISKHIYAKGVEDYLHASDYEKYFSVMASQRVSCEKPLTKKGNL